MMTNLSNEFTDYSPTDLALFDVNDMLFQGITDCAILLGENAKSVYEHASWALEGPLELGIQKTETDLGMLDNFRMIFKDYMGVPFTETDKGFDFRLNDVDVHLKIITKNYDFFRNRDTVAFKVTSVAIPNPFNKYWKIRNFIK